MEDPVESLISSLSGREKAYFRIFSNLTDKKDKKNYEILYDNIIENGFLNMYALEEEYGSNNFIKYISSEKNYLMERLLLSLVNFHFNKMPTMYLFKHILYVNILLDKGLKDKALKLLMNAKKTAYKYEHFSIILSMIEIEENIYFEHGYVYNIQLFNNLRDERRRILSKLNNLNMLKSLSAEFQNLQLQDVHFLVNREEYTNLIQNKVLTDLKYAKSLRAKKIWYYVTTLRDFLLRDFKRCQRQLIETVEFIDRYRYLFTDEEYLQNLSNYMLLSAKTADEKHFRRAEGIILDFKTDDEAIMAFVKDILFTRKMEYFHVMQNYSEAAGLCPDIEIFLKEYKKNIDPAERNYLVLLMLRAFIEAGDYINAFGCLKLWYYTGGIQYRRDLYKLYSFMIYFQLGYLDLLENELNAWVKKVKSVRKLLASEEVMTLFFRKAASLTGKNRHDLIKSTKQKLEQIKQDPAENILYDDFDFTQWLANFVK